MNAASQQRIAALAPSLGTNIQQLCREFDDKFPGWTLEVTQGARNDAEQTALYAQGRQGTTYVNTLRRAVGWAPISDAQNKVVTEAPPGESWHNYSCAADVAPESTTGIDWDSNDEHWEFIVETGESLGMKSGISWKDEPHFQPSQVPVSPDAETKYLFAEGGTRAVWDHYGI